MEYIVWISKDENSGEYMANIPDIAGCIVYRDTYEEVCEAIQDAAELSLEDEDLPVAHSLDHFTDEVLDELSISLTSSKYILNVMEEDTRSYNVELNSSEN